MTKTKLVWRLANRPTPNEVQDLHAGGLITKDEAREILFSEQEEADRDVKSLESEVKFLRELVERLSKNPQTIVTTIREVQRQYLAQPWYKPYEVWCGGASLSTAANSNSLANAYNGIPRNSLSTIVEGTSEHANFSAIKTF